MVSVKVVALRQARPVLGWVNLWVCRQPPRSTQSDCLYMARHYEAEE